MSRLLCCFRTGKVNTSNDNVENNAKENGHTVNGQENQSSGAEEIKKTTSTGGRLSKGGNQSPVLVELFTAQGCSSCLSADLEFSRLGQGQAQDIAGDVPVLTLAYHVDYWNHLGWHDPFASSAWTLRQRWYGQSLQQDTIYTPEMVVQGSAHCIASNSESAAALIRSAPRFPTPDVHATFERLSSSSLRVSLTISLKKKVDKHSLDVMLAIYENGLVTDCMAGENRGKLLTNDFVVKGLEKACTLQDLPAKKAVTGQVEFQLWRGFSRSKSGIVLFLQNPATLEIHGSEQLDLPDTI